MEGVGAEGGGGQLGDLMALIVKVSIICFESILSDVS